jgi:hypothetical protein
MTEMTLPERLRIYAERGYAWASVPTLEVTEAASALEAQAREIEELRETVKRCAEAIAAFDAIKCEDCGHHAYHCPASGCNELECECEEWIGDEPDPFEALAHIRASIPEKYR